MKKCLHCNKQFTPARNRKDGKFCEIKCYQNSRKKDAIDWGQFFFDGLTLTVPIFIVVFVIFFITPKTADHILDKKLKEEKKEILKSSCFDWDEEDEKFYQYLINKRK